MFIKTRNESKELIIYRSLNARMDLSDPDKQQHYNLERGYEGEIMFDALLEKYLDCDCLILNGLLFKLNTNFFQIDSLLIFPNTIYIYEIKNFIGDYYFDGEKFYKKPKTDINNPLHQSNRCELYLRKLLLNLGFTLSIDASVVFINPECTIYQAPLNKPIIYPTQVVRYLKKLNNTPSKLSDKHRLLAERLVAQHIEDYPNGELPSYSFNGLRKGMMCKKCYSLSTSVDGLFCVCDVCGYRERVSTAVVRSVQEFKMLFPNERITTKVIYEWCRIVDSKKRISRILKANFDLVGVRQWSYYE